MVELDFSTNATSIFKGLLKRNAGPFLAEKHDYFEEVPKSNVGAWFSTDAPNIFKGLLQLNAEPWFFQENHDEFQEDPKT